VSGFFDDEIPGVAQFGEQGVAHSFGGSRFHSRSPRLVSIALRVSKFFATDKVRAYAEELYTLLGGTRYVIDTARSGNGGGCDWCNSKSASWCLRRDR